MTRAASRVRIDQRRMPVAVASGDRHQAAPSRQLLASATAEGVPAACVCWSGAVDERKSETMILGEPPWAISRVMKCIALLVLILAVLPGCSNGTDTGSRSTGSKQALAKQPNVIALEYQAKYADLPAYRGVSWANELQAETNAAGSASAFAGSLVHQVGGYRRTDEPTYSSNARAHTVWLSGGSAAWGEGQRDGHTIASDLVHLAAADHIELHVKNIAQRGATFDEEVGGLKAMLDEAPVSRPDIVIEFNGWNDVLAQVAANVVHGRSATRDDTHLSFPDIVAMNGLSKARFMNSGAGVISAQKVALRVTRRIKSGSGTGERLRVLGCLLLAAGCDGEQYPTGRLPCDYRVYDI